MEICIYSGAVLVLAFVLAFVLDPRLSAHAVALVTGASANELVAICWRESRCRAVTTHAIDQRHGARAYARAVDRGLLDPERCLWHARGDARRWSTRGAWGHLAAYAVPYLGCVPPWVLDLPIVSAWVAARRLEVARRSTIPRLRSWARLGLPQKNH